ncbi:unnamed protein product [Malassezia sympodialis ATCC 42132]|uniref:uncharacterized protein n=1 Tax=Malassezia sympodialis (strain ATCC 42132) TaxID=1230383 RepID=UPI0002C1943E|nr:uncharacterized protein MSY001_0537 [Malassezia sympodialis ATCC 42132]CCU97831.1 unnamed protein product [Malassezia sympodialis ATCC 42132]|eukprot:XP_018739164.1 uncharacterized protein MSY001_0537 [Malassezia sympodialis ATCC 42132]
MPHLLLRPHRQRRRVLPPLAHRSGGGPSRSLTTTTAMPGLGSCGKKNSESDMIVAISHSMYDKKKDSNNPNTSPYCGRKIKASYKDKSVEVTVVDRCTGCQFSDLDFSPAAFKKLASMGEGRLKNVKWSFMDNSE